MIELLLNLSILHSHSHYIFLQQLSCEMMAIFMTFIPLFLTTSVLARCFLVLSSFSIFYLCILIWIDCYPPFLSSCAYLPPFYHLLPLV